ncbi:MAG TPA: VOC family protein [Caulobacteraceae bacterium]|nr:VOC family protein [Caulobacteraceae bacterium]
MLKEERLVAFLSTADSKRARAFYEDVLGLTFTGEHEYLVTFDWGSAGLKLQKADKVEPPHGTALSWTVRDLRETMRGLAARGVAFERYPDSHEQDEMGVWSPVPGQGVAWFKDPDGNLLALSGPI